MNALPNPFVAMFEPAVMPDPENRPDPLPIFLANPSKEFLAAVRLLPVPITIAEILRKY